MLMLGASVFAEKKIYVISWFISVVVLFYINYYILCIPKDIRLRIVIACFSALIFYIIRIYLGFFIFYFLGVVAHMSLKRSGILYKEVAVGCMIQHIFNIIFRFVHLVQRNTYEFFLLHGGVLLFFAKVISVKYEYAFMFSIAVSAVLASALSSFVRSINHFIDNIAE